MTRRQARTRELELLRLRLSGLTFSEIGDMIGATRQRAHALVRRAEKRIEDARGEVPRLKKNNKTKRPK